MTKMLSRIKIMLLSALLFLSGKAYSQMSYGGKPLNDFLFPLKEVKFEKMPDFDFSFKVKESKSSSIRLKSLEFAHKFPVHLNPANSGNWKLLSDGRKIWKLGIHSKDAYSLNLIFDKFHLNEGVNLFLYSPDKTHVIGSFNNNNNNDKGLAFSPLPGEFTVMELIVPANLDSYGELNIASVNHDFLGIFSEKASLNGNSGKCNVDINCPEGNAHQLEKNAVMRLVINGTSLCTGALVNNTSKDGKPYVLTANHCLSTQTEASNTVFHFIYETSSCNGTGMPVKSLSGSSLRATKGSLDMTLLELNGIPPLDYRPYYLGWNRQNIAASITTGIHHPNGDWKKISKDFNPPTSVSVSGYEAQAHWKIADWEIGTTEGGSSGSPLLDQISRIVGFLTGGDALCGNSVNDYYGKFSTAWNMFTPVGEQLKAWLDPGNTGELTLNGFNPYQNQPLFADFEINTTFVCQTQVFVFTDFSRGSNITSYTWNFGTGATPATATGKGPHFVSYASVENKTVSLLIGNGSTTHETLKNFSLSIKSTDLPLADFSYTINLKQVNFTNLSVNTSNYYWEFGDGTASTSISPVKNYAANGDYTVLLWVRNGPCSDKITKNLLSVSSPVIEPEVQGLNIYPNPSAGNFFIEFSPDQKLENFEVFTITGKKILSGSFTQSPQLLEMHHLPSGVYLLKLIEKDRTHTRKLLLNR